MSSESKAYLSFLKVFFCNINLLNTNFAKAKTRLDKAQPKKMK